MTEMINEAGELNPIEITDIKYFDQENNKILRVNILIFGPETTISDRATNQFITKIKRISNPPLIEFSSRPLEDSLSDVIVDIGPIFIMSKEKADIVREYAEVNNLLISHIFAHQTNEVLQNIFEKADDEFMEMIEQFIEERPTGFFTNFRNIMLFELFLNEQMPTLFSPIQLSNEETRKVFENSETTYIKKNQKHVSMFFKSDFLLFEKLLKELSDDVDIFSAYTFLFNIVVQFFALKWQEEYGADFEDVDNMELQPLIERFFDLESIDHNDPDTQGRFFYFLHHNKKFNGEENLFDHMAQFNDLLVDQGRNIEFKNFKHRLKKRKDINAGKYSIDDVDLMNGQEFENFIGFLFSKKGFDIEITKTTGDQGIDVIARKNGKNVGIQAKCYSGTVGNGAVQEALAGKAFYGLDNVVVVTNNFFTESAKQLAQASSVVLWDRNILKAKILEAF